MSNLKQLNKDINTKEERLSEIVKEKNDIVEELAEKKSQLVKRINRLTEEQITLNNDVAKARREFNILMNKRPKVSSAKRSHFTSADKTRIIKKKGGKCEECGGGEPLTLHHKNNLSIGGSNKEDNLEVLCTECHEKRHRV
jgi:5-methylcytosine-specific restriction endonuclease McrA